MISHISYNERANYCLSEVAKRLFQLLDEKKTNLALSADVTSANHLLDLADTLGPEICILKTHIDIVEDFTPELIVQLRRLAQKHHFLLFEDRKFADIGHTVQLQYAGGMYHISNWADIINAHTLPGPGTIEGLAEVGRKKNRGLLLVSELSSKGHLIDLDYINNTLRIAEHFADFVMGFITQRLISDDPHWIYLTPGVKLEKNKDKLGQQYITPEKAITENGTDIIIVGRGIIASKNPLVEAQKYRERGWNSYLQRME